MSKKGILTLMVVFGEINVDCRSLSGVYEYDPNETDLSEKCYYANEWIRDFRKKMYYLNIEEFYLPSTNRVLVLGKDRKELDNDVEKYGNILSEEQAEELQKKYKKYYESEVYFKFYPYDYMDQVSDDEINDFLYSCDNAIGYFKEYREKLRNCESIKQEEEFFLRQVKSMEDYLKEKNYEKNNSR